ncbi:YaaC family protein [Thomasclavelia spiroformis]|uniref:YaaC family protein n=1 Tax=Thomasclavelia spiroformis TaxID=29348 RepID=UPI00241D36E3|nr:YaaC family protein [Thomasclavelia spiroformis]
MTTIFSENPENDLWRELLQFTYEANIKRYLSKRGYEADDETINCIAGSFLQASEYYKAAKDANLQISPLLLYYGSTNLLYGMVNLLSGSINKIKNHGMKIYVPEQMDFISSTQIRFLSPVDGGIHVVARSLGFTLDLTGFGDWILSEFLDSIAEICTDFIQCYGVQTGCIAMLDVFNTPDGKTEKIYFSKDNKENFIDLFKKVEGFEKSYLNVRTAKELVTGKEYFILRHKMTGKDISEQSYSGQPYLRAGHIKNSKLITIPTILNMYISLFVLASLCRYYPERWSPFILKDTTGEKLLIEKFMYYARRLIPNYVLNKLLESTVQYSSNRYTVKDTIKLVGEHQVQEIVERKVKLELDRQHIFIKGKK